MKGYFLHLLVCLVEAASYMFTAVMSVVHGILPCATTDPRSDAWNDDSLAESWQALRRRVRFWPEEPLEEESPVPDFRHLQLLLEKRIATQFALASAEQDLQLAIMADSPEAVAAAQYRRLACDVAESEAFDVWLRGMVDSDKFCALGNKYGPLIDAIETEYEQAEPEEAVEELPETAKNPA